MLGIRSIPFLIAGGLLFLPARGALAQAPPDSQIGIVSATYQDLDGDHDPFPDSGETGRLVLRLRNGPAAFTGVSVILTSTDAEVDCIPEYKVAIGSLAPGQVFDIGSLNPALPGFTFKVAAGLTSTSGADPARIDVCVRLKTDASVHVGRPTCFSLAADLDLPAGPAPGWIPGPDGAPGTGDDGTLLETFDTDRDGDGTFTVNDTFRLADAGTGLTDHGAYMRATGQPPSAFTAVICGGYSYFDEADCSLDPDFPMDWHIHCPPGATSCPNLQSGPCNDPLGTAACTYATPADGQKALSPPNSLHMGVHFAGLDSIRDTTRFRSIQAYRTGPINLTPLPRPGDLQFSMYQIADLMDDVFSSNLFDRFPCADCGTVQIQVDRNPDPAVDDWGFWDDLVPFENVYDHVPAAWSYYGDSYCVYTPTDTGTAAPAPNGSHETLCYSHGAFSSCGTVRGSAPASVASCAGPGIVDPSGSGVWVQTKFDLASYLGQRVRIRWVAETWVFDNSRPHYAAAGGAWETSVEEDGWWLDDVRVTGVIAAQSSPVPDARPAATGSCPAGCTDLDGDGYGAPGSSLCPAGPGADCDDLRSDLHPGATEICNRLDDDCDGSLSPQEIDDDHDGYTECSGDCNDQDPSIYWLAIEVNDGKDNQCPGRPGYGLVDEMGNALVFQSQIRLAWNGQQLATSYQIVRSDRKDFVSGCTVVQQSVRTLDDAAEPPAGGLFYYLVRAAAPNVGSWDANSSGERVVPCVP